MNTYYDLLIYILKHARKYYAMQLEIPAAFYLIYLPTNKQNVQ